MWGLRAIRVGLMVGGLFALLMGAGCSHDFWCGGYPGDCAPRSGRYFDGPPAESKAPEKEKSADEVQKEWKRGGWFEDQPSHLTPERVKGGIY